MAQFCTSDTIAILYWFILDDEFFSGGISHTQDFGNSSASGPSTSVPKEDDAYPYLITKGSLPHPTFTGPLRTGFIS